MLNDLVNWWAAMNAQARSQQDAAHERRVVHGNGMPDPIAHHTEAAAYAVVTRVELGKRGLLR